MKVSKHFFVTGILLLLSYFCTVLWPFLFFLVGVSIHSFQFIISSFSFFAIAWFIVKKIGNNYSLSHYILHCVAIIFIFFICAYICNGFYDISFDGNWYHMDAVYNLVNGWNPAKTQLLPEQTSYCESYLNHFPKCSWVFGASITAFSGFIEAGKLGTLLLIISVLFVWQYVALTVLKFQVMVSWLSALIIAVNPIHMLNILSYYTDGQLSCMFTLAIAFILLFANDKKSIFLILTLICLSLLANYKFTSAIYAGIIAFFLLIYCWHQNYQTVKKLMLIFLGWGIFTYAIIGFNPYITNTIYHHHPLYPLSESNDKVFSKKDIYPANFFAMNWAERFYSSVFAEPSWNRNPDESHTKKLFAQTNLNSYNGGVPDLAAFGPMFPEVLVILLPIFLVACFFSPKKELGRVILIMGILAFTIIINPEAWVLRYVPQFWLFTLAMFYLLWLNPKLKYVAALLSIALLLNSYMISREYLENNKDKTNHLNAQFALLKSDIQHYEIYNGWTKSFKNRLGANGFDTAHLVWIPPQDTSAIEFVGSLGGKYRKIK